MTSQSKTVMVRKIPRVSNPVTIKSTEVPNPRRSSACDCTCYHARSVLFLPMHSVLKGFRLFHALCILSLSLLAMRIVLFLPMQSLLTSFWCFFTGLVQLTFSFPSWFHTIWFYCSHTFHSFLLQNTLCFSFGSKDMITAFTYLPSYRYSSFTLRECLCWRNTYCQWPIYELAKNVSPKNKWPLATRSRFIRMRVFRWIKNGRPIM